MGDAGVYVKGMLASYECAKDMKGDVFYYLVVYGMESMKVKSKENYTDRLAVGDLVNFRINIGVFNGKLFVNNGTLCE